VEKNNKKNVSMLTEKPADHTDPVACATPPVPSKTPGPQQTIKPIFETHRYCQITMEAFYTSKKL